LLLADHQIRDLCKQGMVVPYNEELLNPASLDVTLGDHLMVEVEHTPELQLLSIEHHTKENPYWLAPQEFVLAETTEIFAMPDDVAGLFFLKSSRAREGFEHLHAGVLDPGWHGSKLTLELINARHSHNLPLWPGMKIGQVVFMPTAGKPEISYAQCGHYNLQPQVTPSWEA